MTPIIKGRRLVMLTGLAVSIAGFPGLAQEKDFEPVTDTILQNPDPADWLHWRRTAAAWGYSPLDQINRRNVAQLRLVWAWALEPGSQQTTPLVYDGVMYIANPGNIIQALDAATGEFIWEYRREFPDGADGTGRALRSLAIYDDKVFVNTSDAHIVALDARDGSVAWETQVADRSLGYYYSSGPLVVGGKVTSGLTGCGRYKDESCYIVALDARTGNELWRTSTVARPGEAGGDSWGDLPLMFRAGSDAWMTGSYDPTTDLIYWGTSQAKPHAAAVRGTTGATLYTNSTLALDPDTGEMKWYYQHIPGDSHDMDEAFERILVDYDGRRSVFTMGKLGILWEVDRQTGAFVSAKDLGYQTIVDVDPRTGTVTHRPGVMPEIGIAVDYCPSASGLKSLRAMAYHPRTQAFYIPLNLNCVTAVFGEVERVAGGSGASGGPYHRTNHFHPKSPDHIGEFLAMDRDSGEVLWRQRTRTPPNSSALTTGGGLAFVGDWDRHMYAYDAETGDTLWETRMPTSVQGSPITYAVGGRQYLAVPVGTGGASWGTLLPAELAPEKHRPSGGNGIFVFALPEGR